MTEGAASGYEQLEQRLGGALTDFDNARGDLRAQWQDAAAARVAPHLDEAAGQANELLAALAVQTEQHQRVEQLCRLITEHAAEVDRLLAEVADAETVADSALTEADRATGEATALADSSRQQLDRALSLVGHAGAACGEAPRLDAIRGMVEQRVVAQRKRAVWVAAGKAFAVEAAWTVGDALVQQVAGIPEGAVPGEVSDHVRTQLETHGPVARTHAEALVERVREAGKTSEVGQQQEHQRGHDKKR